MPGLSCWLTDILDARLRPYACPPLPPARPTAALQELRRQPRGPAGRDLRAVSRPPGPRPRSRPPASRPRAHRGPAALVVALSPAAPRPRRHPPPARPGLDAL